MDANNWTWAGGPASLQYNPATNTSGDYPGDTVNRKDDDVVMAGSLLCTLTGNLAEVLDGLTVSNFTSTLTISGKAEVAGATATSGFTLASGTVALSGGTLQLDYATRSSGGRLAHTWTNGSIGGVGGFLSLVGGELDVSGLARYCSATINIGQDANAVQGVLKLQPILSGNIALLGYNNGVNINQGGDLILGTNTTAATADAQGGFAPIAGSHPINIFTGGILERGIVSGGTTGSVQIGEPVYVQGGRLTVWAGNGTPTDALHVTGTDPTTQASVVMNTAQGGNIVIDHTATLQADSGVLIDTAVAGAGLTFLTDLNSTPLLVGNLTVGQSQGGQVKINPGTASSGFGYVTGNVTLGANAVYSLPISDGTVSTRTVLDVMGNVSLDGTLQFWGANEPPLDQYFPIIDCLKNYTLSGHFSSILWPSHPNTVWLWQPAPDGTGGTYFDVARHS
jgi:hypothetical protein